MWLRLAPALILFGNEEGYAAFRGKLAGIVGDDSSLGICDRFIKTCLLLTPPPGFIGRLPAAPLREELGQDDQRGGANWYDGSLALAELQSRALPEAEAHTVKTLGKGRTSYSDGLNLAVRSMMAQARQDELEEARRSLGELTRILGSVSNPRPLDHLIADILRREAEGLLKSQPIPAKDDSSNAPTTPAGSSRPRVENPRIRLFRQRIECRTAVP